MSVGAQVAVLAPRRPGRAEPEALVAQPHRSAATIVAFAIFAFYGLLRWSTMLASPPLWRMVALVALCVGVVLLGGIARRRRGWARVGAVVAILAGIVAIVPLCGFPVDWVVHVRLARAVDGISSALTALPDILIPYAGSGPGDEIGSVILFGGVLLMLSAALMLAGNERGVGTPRLAAAALALLVLAIVPSTLSAPRFPYVHGAVLFVLVCALVFSERVAPGRALLAAGAIGVVTIGAMAISPALGRHGPWVRVSAIGGTLGPARRADEFSWRQSYGPLQWPHQGLVVLDVRSAFPYHWKAEDLDLFDGYGWAQAQVGGDLAAAETTVSAANRARWTQTVRVSVGAMLSDEMISAGYADQPTFVGVQQTAVGDVEPGAVAGTWLATTPVEAGDTYEVRAYTPAPQPGQLRRAGVAYPLADLAAELQMLLPVPISGGASQIGAATFAADPVLAVRVPGARERIRRNDRVTGARSDRRVRVCTCVQTRAGAQAPREDAVRVCGGDHPVPRPRLPLHALPAGVARPDPGLPVR